jgi:hypothetical protein
MATNISLFNVGDILIGYKDMDTCERTSVSQNGKEG